MQQKTPASPPREPEEHTVLLENTSWDTYERLIAERQERPVPHFTYDQGVLEIVSPSTEHDRVSRLIALLVEELAAEMGVDVDSVGSTTFKRYDLEGGFEPDECFYFSENVSCVRDKYNLDLSVDPPPDLVVEIDFTSSSLDKLPVYARLGVGEVWRYEREQVVIYTLQEEGGYVQSETSAALEPLTGEVLTRFIKEGRTLRRSEWLGKVRQWAQANLSR